MSKKRPRIIGSVFVLIGFLLIAMAWGGHLQSKAVVAKGGRAVARITDKKVERSHSDLKEGGPAGTDYNVYYVFETRGAKIINGRYPLRKELWDRLETGGTVDVAYDFDNPSYNFPVGEGSLVSAGMPAALSVFGLVSLVIGCILFKGKRSFQQEQLSVSLSPEDNTVLRLLDRIKSGSMPILFGSYHSHVVFSDGRLLEIADSLPAVIDALRDLSTNRLSEQSIKQLLPGESDGGADKIQGGRMLSDKYQLTTPTCTCSVDAVYYEYLKMRYPKADAFCRGPAQPIIFRQDGILRAVVMPVKGKS